MIQGETILGVNLRSTTVLNYVKSACKFFKDNDLPSPRKADVNYIDTVISALRNFEKVPDQRNMITDQMIHWMHAYVKTLPQDAPECAIFDWLLLGRYAGFRKSEWCQSTQSDFDRIKEWPGMPPYGFILSDFEFFMEFERSFQQTDIMTIDTVYSVRLRWRKQKNKDNGQIISFNCDLKHPDFCPV